jgi:hypothetical protein
MMLDGFLVAVTAVSLVLAVAMAVMTWRVFRQQRARAAAPSHEGQAVQDSWPAVGIARDRGAVRERALAEPKARVSDAAEPAWARTPLRRTIELRPTPFTNTPGISERAIPAAAPAADPTPGSRGGVSLVTAGAVCGALVLFALGAAWAIANGRDSSASTSPAAAQVASPLELVALDYARDGSQASIRGLVRNPASGSKMQQLEAVIVLFDRRGSYVGTTHAPVADGQLAPGTERSFEVPLAAGLDVSQYRVSFRVAAAPVPYVDRRSAPLAAPPARQNVPPTTERPSLPRSAALVS